MRLNASKAQMLGLVRALYRVELTAFQLRQPGAAPGASGV